MNIHQLVLTIITPRYVFVYCRCLDRDHQAFSCGGGIQIAGKGRQEGRGRRRRRRRRVETARREAGGGSQLGRRERSVRCLDVLACDVKIQQDWMCLGSRTDNTHAGKVGFHFPGCGAHLGSSCPKQGVFLRRRRRRGFVSTLGYVHP